MSSSPPGPANYTWQYYRDLKQGQDLSDSTTLDGPRYCVRIPDNTNWEAQCYVPLFASEFTPENEEALRKCCPGTLTVESDPQCGYVCLTNTSAEDMWIRENAIWTTCIEQNTTIDLNNTNKNWSAFGNQAVCWNRESLEKQEDLYRGASGPRLHGNESNLKLTVLISFLLSGGLFHFGLL